MKTVIIVQARMTSTRLPGKVLKQVLGKPLLEYQLERLKRVKNASEIVIATTTNETDQPIVEWCQHLGVAFFRGSEPDVLARYHDAAEAHKAEVIVRITSDCPLIDPEIVDRAIAHYLSHIDTLDYVSNGLELTYPRGMDVEVFSRRALDEANAEAMTQEEHEHVTPFIYHRPERYRLANIALPERQDHHRWTVDTVEDLELVSRIIRALYPTTPAFSLKDILSLLQQHPDWANLNVHIRQKTLA